MYSHNLTSLFRPVTRLIERCRPAFFSPQEWWFQLGMVVLTFPLGTYLNVGPSYLTDRNAFVWGTLWNTLIYPVGVVMSTLLIRRILARYPRFQQNIQRTLVMIAAGNVLALGWITAQYGLFCALPYLERPFDWAALQQQWLIGVFFVTAMSILANVLYAYGKWKREQADVEALKSQTVQQQLEALKQQVNPHFLFNSLSSISALVSEDTEQAEHFVDGLAKVYRYMLQATNRPQAPLGEELTFARIYASLLEVRFGRSLQIELPPQAPEGLVFLPTLSLQVLIDNAIKHNRMSPQEPLLIKVGFVEGSALRVSNTLQRKTRRVELDRHGLGGLVERYRLLTDQPVEVSQQGAVFAVTLPLLAAPRSEPV